MKRLCLAVAVLLTGCFIALAFAAAAPEPDDFPAIVNTQKAGEHPPTPAEAAAKITVPEGFKVTLFAGEPDVAQPISFTIDDRGRLWVVECYTYAGNEYDDSQADRIVIFEDADNDGRFDNRKVFWDQGKLTTSVVWGFGGAWVLSHAELLFIPDRDGDDVPDGEPVLMLDGFTDEASHNLVNGLMWGPDGWLYGRHGILATSHIGRPAALPDQRVAMNAGIWRFHPTRHVVEAVAHGTTNPWGLDYDDHGQFFFTNNVIGHLWHLVPGAHYKRMYGEDFNPYLYELIEQTADHYHWNTGEDWTKSREGGSGADTLGGGHSHCGGMIYLGDNWPAEYRNNLFTGNVHGRRVNRDTLHRDGAGYVAKHAPDFLFANQPWFRGTELRYGPDGGVYLSDWSDLGECHDHDGVHRTSGRIYKVIQGEPRPNPNVNIAKLSNDELVKLQLHRNDWYVRTARRVLQERAAAPGSDMKAVHAALRQMFDSEPDVTRKLRAMWALHASGGAGGAEHEWLVRQLEHQSEHVRAWAVKLLVDDPAAFPADLPGRLTTMAASDDSGLVRLFLASAMQRLPLASRLPIARGLSSHAVDVNDPVLPLMVWYGIEPMLSIDAERAIALLYESKLPLTRRLIARRITSDLAQAPAPVNAMVAQLAAPANTHARHDVLAGMTEALRGWRKAPPPPAWTKLQPEFTASDNPGVRDLALELAVVFGDGRAMDELRDIALDKDRPPDERRNALRVLIEARVPDFAPVLQGLATDRDVAAEAIRGLAAYDDPKTADLLVKRFGRFRHEARPEAINTLASRPASAKAMLLAIERGDIPHEMLTAFHARQIQAFNDPELNKLLETNWGAVRQTPAEKQQLIERYRQRLTPDILATADLAAGRLTFTQLCMACHKLHGQGGTIGPDITGANRDNLDYLLSNIIDPSAMVANDFRMATVTLKDGRVVTGAIVERTDRTVAVQGLAERLTLDRNDVARIDTSPVSLMPEGLMQVLTDEQVRNLIGYLMSKQQVPLPPE